MACGCVFERIITHYRLFVLLKTYERIEMYEICMHGDRVLRSDACSMAHFLVMHFVFDYIAVVRVRLSAFT